MLTPGASGGGAGVATTQIENANGVVINPATGFAIPPFDQIVINYTDSTKTTIATVVYNLMGSPVATITLTQGTTDDTYTQT